MWRIRDTLSSGHFIAPALAAGPETRESSAQLLWSLSCDSSVQRVQLGVHLILGECSLPHGPLAKLDQVLTAWIPHQFEIGGIHLGMAVKRRKCSSTAVVFRNNANPWASVSGKPCLFS